MKQQKTLRLLVPLIGALGLTAACAGLLWQGGEGGYAFTSLRGQEADIFGHGLYQYDTLMVAAGFRGTDMVTIFIVLPLLLIAYRGYRRGRVKSVLLLAGALAFFLYNSISMSFAAAYNPLFLLYIALMSSSLFSLILSLQAIDPAEIDKQSIEGMPRTVMLSYFIIAGAGVLFLWGSEIFVTWQSGLLTYFLAPYTTMVTHGLDMGVIAPSTFIVAAMLRREDPNAVRFGFPLAVLNILIGLCVISQTIMQLRAGVVFNIGQLIGMIGSWILLAGFAAWTLVSMARHMKE